MAFENMSDRCFDVLSPSRERHFIVSVTLILLTFGFFQSLLTPLYRGPDETQHIDMVIAVFKEHDWPAPGDRYVDLALRASKRRTKWNLRSRRREIEEATPRGQRPTWNEIEQTVQGRRTEIGGINPVSQHPFLYYLMLAIPWSGLRSPVLGLAHDQAASGLRLLNLLFLAPLPLLVLGTARALGLDAATTRLSVILLLFIPQLVHLTGLVNNDNLMILAGAMVTFLLARVLGGDGSLRTAIVLGAALGVAPCQLRDSLSYCCPSPRLYTPMSVLGDIDYRSSLVTGCGWVALHF